MKPASIPVWARTISAALVVLPAILQAEEATPAGASPGHLEAESGGVAPVPAGRPRFWQRITAYEPNYFLVEPAPPGGRDLNAKLQFSFAFQLLGNPHLEIEQGDERADGLYTAYSQTSFWDLAAESRPFLDTSYRPEAFWHEGFEPGLLGSDGLAGEIGVSHESNGRAGEDSRGYNTVFIRPMMRWDLPEGVWLRASPRLQTYIGSLDGNPAIKHYRGIGDVDVAIGVRDGALLTLMSRISKRSCVQADLSYPVDRFTAGWLHGYLYAQYFWGYSETLLDYNKQVEQPRMLIGFAFTR